MKKTTKLLGVSIITLLFFTSTAYAQSGSRSNSATNVNNEVDGLLSIALETKIDTDLKVDLNESTEVSDDTSSDSDVNKKTESNTGVLLKVNTSGIAITSSTQVSSEEDLKVFSSNISSQNKSVDRVDVSSENTANTKVEVVYKHKGKLLWFIPVVVKSKTMVEAKENSETEVKSNLQWWSFLVVGVNHNKADVESNIRNDARVQANAKVSASAQAKAQVAEAVIAKLQSNVATQANANVR